SQSRHLNPHPARESTSSRWPLRLSKEKPFVSSRALRLRSGQAPRRDRVSESCLYLEPPPPNPSKRAKPASRGGADSLFSFHRVQGSPLPMKLFHCRNVHDVAAVLLSLGRRAVTLDAVEQFFGACADLARMACAYDSRNYFAVGSEEQCRRYRLDSQVIDQPRVGQRDWIIDPELFDKRRDRPQPFALDQVARDPDYHQAARLVVLAVECDQFGNLLAARPAPGRPEIDDHRMAPVMTQVDFFAVEAGRAEIQAFIGRRLVRLRRVEPQQRRRRLVQREVEAEECTHDQRQRDCYAERAQYLLPADHTCSTTVAMPWPIPIHIVATPSATPRRRISCVKVTISRAPEHPSGCPSATAPPFTLSRCSSILRSVLQARTCAPNASLISNRSMSPILSPARASALCVEGTGPHPIISGRSPATAVARIFAIGLTPSARARSALISSTAAAPSLNCEELPAVTWPSGLNEGLSPASFSKVVSARGPWSMSTTAPSGSLTGAISSLKRSRAATARRFERSENASASARVILYIPASRSAVSPMKNMSCGNIASSLGLGTTPDPIATCVMCSTPPAIATSPAPVIISIAAKLTACRLEPHWRSSVVP